MFPSHTPHSYVWQRPDWPCLHWDTDRLIEPLAQVNALHGRLVGQMSMTGLDRRGAAQLDALTSELLGSSAIEGVALHAESVRSSIARKLGIDLTLPTGDTHYIDGLVSAMFDAVVHRHEPLTAERIFNWHAALFPTGRSGATPITVGSWRVGEEPMQVVSGALGHEKVHYQAPPSNRVPTEMDAMLSWANTSEIPDFLKAGVVSLWFVTIHPFDDGNGRISRTLAQMFLSREAANDLQYYSISAVLLSDRKHYYEAIEQAQRGSGDITPWLLWFLGCVQTAINISLAKIQTTLEKALFWERLHATEINPRQRKILNLLWDGLEGKLTTQKYAKINHCSQDTALRDIRSLVEKEVLADSGERGRNTNYILIKDR